MRLLTGLFWFGVLVGSCVAMTGCATAVPYNECNNEPVCEAKAIRREDMRFLREQELIEKEQCNLPRIWDGRSRQCRTQDTWL